MKEKHIVFSICTHGCRTLTISAIAYYLHKLQNLRVSLENPFDWKFLKINLVIVYILQKRLQLISMLARLCPSHSSEYQGFLCI